MRLLTSSKINNRHSPRAEDGAGCPKGATMEAGEIEVEAASEVVRGVEGEEAGELKGI